MAYCTNCGKAVGDGRFCPHCGAKQQMEIPSAAASNMSNSGVASNPVRSQTASDPYRPASWTASSHEVAPQFPMKWHKFMIYFVLWINALGFFANGVTYASSANLSGSLGLFALIDFALAAACVYVRFQLAGLRQGAPKKLLILLVCCVAMSVMEYLIVSLFTEDTTLTWLISSLGQMLYNWRYYASRQELFVN